jgi:CRP-like cAMP-binding protein
VAAFYDLAVRASASFCTSVIVTAVIIVGSSHTDILQRLQRSPDRRAAGEVLAPLPDGGSSWATETEALLCEALLQGRTTDAEGLGAGLIAARQVLDPEADATRYARRVGTLLSGVRSVLAGREILDAVAQLTRIAAEKVCQTRLRWVAWIWISTATSWLGDLPRSSKAATKAAALASELETREWAISQCVLAAVLLLQGDPRAARDHLFEAVSVFDRLDEHRWFSQGCLALSHSLAENGNHREALRAAQQALDAEPDWPPPAIWLSRRALVAGQASEARRVLEPLTLLNDLPAVVEREARLVTEIERARVPLAPVLEHLWLCRGPIDEAAANEIVAVAGDHRDLHALLEVAGWDLASAGHLEHAGGLFQALAEVPALPREVRRSVARGLALVNRKEPPPVPAVMLILERGRREAAPGADVADAAQTADLFWYRRAVIGGDLDRAARILDAVEGTTVHPDEVERERRLLDSLDTGLVPADLVAEYYWLRERPLTPMIASQLSAFAEEHGGFVPLREVIAWDLANAGYAERAKDQFEALSVEANLDPVTHESVRLGIRKITEELRPLTPTQEQRGIIDLLSRFVRDGQRWPTVLDEHCLMFTGPTRQLHGGLPSAETVFCSDGASVCRQGEPGPLLTICTSGALEITRDRGQPQSLGTVQAGSFFGEIGTIWGIPNTIAAVAVGSTQLEVISRERLLTLVKAGDPSANTLLKTLRSWYVEVVLTINPIFAPLKPEIRAQLIERSPTTTVRRGHLIVEQGQKSRLMMLVHGFAQVTASDRGGRLQSLGLACPGDLVGELDPSPTSVTAATNVTLVPIEAKLLSQLPDRALENLEKRRRACGNVVRQLAATRSRG